MSERYENISRGMKLAYYSCSTDRANELKIYYRGWLNGLAYGSYISLEELATLLVENENFANEILGKSN